MMVVASVLRCPHLMRVVSVDRDATRCIGTAATGGSNDHTERRLTRVHAHERTKKGRREVTSISKSVWR